MDGTFFHWLVPTSLYYLPTNLYISVVNFMYVRRLVESAFYSHICITNAPGAVRRYSNYMVHNLGPISRLHGRISEIQCVHLHYMYTSIDLFDRSAITQHRRYFGKSIIVAIASVYKCHEGCNMGRKVQVHEYFKCHW